MTVMYIVPFGLMKHSFESESEIQHHITLSLFKSIFGANLTFSAV